jgi:hypothetical protein
MKLFGYKNVIKKRFHTCSFNLRIRMLRVKNDSCVIHPDFQNAISECYDTYTTGIEDTRPFGNGVRLFTSEDA